MYEIWNKLECEFMTYKNVMKFLLLSFPGLFVVVGGTCVQHDVIQHSKRKKASLQASLFQYFILFLSGRFPLWKCAREALNIWPHIQFLLLPHTVMS